MRVFSLTFFLFILFSSFSFGQVKSKSSFERMLANSNSKSARSIINDGTEYSIKDSHTDDDLGVEYYYLQQTYKSIKVFNVIKTTIFKNGIFQYSSGKFITDIASKAPIATPTITASDAVTKVASHLGLANPSTLAEVANTFTSDKKIVYSAGGIAKQNINTELVWVSKDNGKTVCLAWNVEIEPLQGSDYWHVRVDAATGAIINKGNYTVHERNNTTPLKKNFQRSQNSQSLNLFNENGNAGMNALKVVNKLMAPPPPPSVTSAQYNVIPYPSESPFITDPTLVTNPWTLSGTTNKATTYGWHFDGTTNYKLTRGNNVYVYDDSLNKNKPGRPDTSTTAIPTLTFNFTPDFTKAPTLTQNRKFAEANLFYWNNIMHDITYQYGFTESAGNFQNNNISRGGVAGDYVRAEAQDGSGTDNSNFSTLPDGQTARMQMYLFNTNIISGNTITVSSPSAIAADYTYVESAFSTANKLARLGAVTGDFVLYNDDAAGTTHIACTGAPVNNISGKIVLIDRLTCSFTSKVLLAQDAGAKAVIMVNKDSTAIFTMSGTDNTITIPAVMISIADGAKIKSQLAAGNTVTGTINVAKVGQKFDGDLDNSIITHEFTHGISNRLTGGASTTSCLDNNEEGGEGWSDYVALMTTTDWSKAQLTDGTKKRIIGNYAWDQSKDIQVGVRTYPYSTDTSVDKHTYKDVGDTANNPQTDNTGKVIPGATEVHYIGEVWCSVLWDMTWDIIQQEGVINGNLFDTSVGGGNTVALKLVMQGLKLQPCSPGFIDARDAILAADSILYNNAHKCAIWKAFAGRGMGYSASQGSSDTCGDEKVAFDVPPCTLPLSLLDFAASASVNKVFVNWSTAAETNTSGYAVEYSTDGASWTSIGSVSAKNVVATSKYSFTHYQPITGSNYYRLKMLDKDGTFKYSKVVVVKITGKTLFTIYPNPVKETLTTELYKTAVEKVNIKIVDAAGRVLQTKQVVTQPGDNVYQLNTASLSKGTYLIVVEGATKEVKQFVKQ